MLGVIILIIFFVVFIISIILMIKYLSFKKYLIQNFKDNSCYVYGKKRKGKDLTFQYVINHRRDFYYSNINYGGKHKIIEPKELTCEPNTYENFINGDYVKTKHKFYEGKDYYISDAGNIFPAQYDSLLHKKFPSLPIFQSLSGHLYDSRVHVNAQTLERVWKPIREQADFFVWCKGTIKLFGLFFIVSMTTYEKFETARQYLFPLKKVHFNKYNKADLQRYYAQNGMIRNGHIIIARWRLHYNTRVFETYLLKGKRKYYKRTRR